MVLAGFTVVALKAAPASDDDTIIENGDAPGIDWHDEVRPA